MATAEPNQPVNLIGVRLHVLTPGSRYDLERRVAYPPPARVVEEP
jgi:hypothetical protein